MAKSGLWITVGGDLSHAVTNSIERDEQFSTTVAAYGVKPRPAELVLVSIDGPGVDYIGISQAGRRVATGQITVAISNLVPIEALSCDDLRDSLPRRLSQWFAPPSFGAYRPTPRLWEETLKIIGRVRPEVGRKIEELRQIIAGARVFRGRVEGGLEVFERDAVASALQVWGGTSLRKRVLRKAGPPAKNAVAPFLSQLREVSVREDPQIDHDHATFPGMEIARRDVVGSVVLTHGDEYLTILNCNRQPLEQTLGVDLIYYNHQFESFVLVQYKRMTEGKVGAEYRPENDQSHEKELQRMIQTERFLKALPKEAKRDTYAFRLSGRPFYVKLCESKAKAALDAGMVSGMYVPLGLWRRLLNSPEALGPRGGIVITWENCARRLSNGEFTNLLRHGWIGSTSGQSKGLAKIIEDVLGSGRMLVLAATSLGRISEDMRRDAMGRFAADDDPAGSI